MSEKKPIIPIENYKKLCCAILQQAYYDYVEGLTSDYVYKDFLLNAQWLDYINIDVSEFYRKSRLKRDAKEKQKAERLLEYQRSKAMDRTED